MFTLYFLTVQLFVMTLTLDIRFADAQKEAKKQLNYDHTQTKYSQKLTTDFEAMACSSVLSQGFQREGQAGKEGEISKDQCEKKASQCTQLKDDMEDRRNYQEVVTTSLAVVPYDENKILPHEKSSRQFDIAGHSFTIHQDWHGLGVAAVVWDSAVVLAEYLNTHKHLIEEKKVLELGAGTGLTGLVAAALGAEVTVTEREEAMVHLTSSVKNNTAGKPWKITCKALDWTENSAVNGLTDFDVILGADIIYIEDTFKDLLQTIVSLAPSNRVLILLSCRLRYDRDTKFLDMLKEDFDVNEIFFDGGKNIKIFSVRRRDL